MALDLSRLPDDTRLEYLFSVATFEQSERHDWSLVRHGLGAIGIWARPSSMPRYIGRERWYGGVEVHYASPPDHADYCGHQDHCWLLSGPCWTDGSSLQFSEQVEHLLPDPTGGPLGADAILAALPTLIDRFSLWLAASATEGAAQ